MPIISLSILVSLDGIMTSVIALPGQAVIQNFNSAAQSVHPELVSQRVVIYPYLFPLILMEPMMLLMSAWQPGQTSQVRLHWLQRQQLLIPL